MRIPEIGGNMNKAQTSFKASIYLGPQNNNQSLQYAGGKWAPGRDNWRNWLRDRNKEFYERYYNRYVGAKFQKDILSKDALALVASISPGLYDITQKVRTADGSARADIIADKLIAEVDANGDKRTDLKEIMAYNDRNPQRPLMELSAGARKFAELSDGNAITEESLLRNQPLLAKLGRIGRVSPDNLVTLQETDLPGLSSCLSDKNRREGIIVKDLLYKYIGHIDKKEEGWTGDAWVDDLPPDRQVYYYEAEALIDTWNHQAKEQTATFAAKP